jgi:2-keto-4-pentenoate hydratase/2-oxohepta-3-ene-1,7-dioic acid hydratase in catechol pathway
MKLVSYELPTRVGRRRRIGALYHEGLDIVDLNLAYYCLAKESGSPRPSEEADFFIPTDMLEFLRGGEQCLAAADRALSAVPEINCPDGLDVVLPVAEVRLLAPVPRPPTIRAFSVFEGHGSVNRKGEPLPANWYRRPMAEKLMPAAVTGPQESLTWPHYTTRLDPQASIGFYVGRSGRDLDLPEAESRIAGWTIFIDPVARDGGRFAGAYKWRNFQYVMGPCLVTPDEFDERSARVTIRVNSEAWFEGTTGEGRQFWAPALLAYTSDHEAVYPGEFIGLGAIGTSASVDHGRWVQPGDLYEVEVEGLGTIRSRVGQPQPRTVGWGAEGMRPRIGTPDVSA